MIDLFGQENTPPSEFYTDEQKNNWLDKFNEYANKEYEENADLNGRFCCGYDWCCDKCKQETWHACQDCVITIVEILKENNVLIDYEDYDFKKWEEIAKIKSC